MLYESGLLKVARTRQPSGLLLVGDVDAFAVPVLESALRTLADTPGNIHLELSQLQFMDVSGLELVVSTARGMRDGRQLVLHELSPHLRRVMALVGWDSTPGLAFTQE
ncbi:STAS domain-containing protein [Wenjunlia tyrosinilytica]|uniref:STAS domain-containing protein n=1 Tax=Wenjunlia tyrosinilytica TaxID=1544741 RepID=UPI001E5EBB21|nr:STAS domain-containing protein [Wenjunlia tyrosinilytica]